jgi:hypothetical protein
MGPDAYPLPARLAQGLTNFAFQAIRTCYRVARDGIQPIRSVVRWPCIRQRTTAENRFILIDITD